jgi:hypothetical protein
MVKAGMNTGLNYVGLVSTVVLNTTPTWSPVCLQVLNLICDLPPLLKSMRMAETRPTQDLRFRYNIYTPDQKSVSHEPIL